MDWRGKKPTWLFQPCRKSIWQYSTPFHNKKILSKLEIEGNFLNIIQAICEKPTVNVTYNGERLKVLAREIRQEKEIKSAKTGKEEVKSSLFTDDIISYVENPKDYTHTHTHTKPMLKLINCAHSGNTHTKN